MKRSKRSRKRHDLTFSSILWRWRGTRWTDTRREERTERASLAWLETLSVWGSWGPLDRRQPSREAETITQHQIQCTGMEGWREMRRHRREDWGGGGGRVGTKKHSWEKVEDTGRGGESTCPGRADAWESWKEADGEGGEKKKKRTSADQEEVRGEGVKGRKSEREGDSTYSLCNSLYHQPRSWRMNSDPSQPSAEAR